jgi:hypothetical protein
MVLKILYAVGTVIPPSEYYTHLVVVAVVGVVTVAEQVNFGSALYRNACKYAIVIRCYVVSEIISALRSAL